MNYIFMLIYIMAILFIKLQYEKYLELNGESWSYRSRDIQDIIMEMIFIGLAAGIGGSAVIVSLGITIEAEAVKYLFMSICFLALINLRYACISYSAGFISLISLIFGFPRLDIPSLLAMAAIMQLAESILIYFLGAKDNIPVFIKHNNELTGAFMIRKFWPVPIVFMTAVLNEAVKANRFISISWQSLFTPQALKTGAFALGLDCIIAVLCYTDLAISTHPEKKSRQSGARFFFYSLILLIISLASIKTVWLRYAGAIFCIGAHEAITLYGSHKERKGKPLFSAVRRGLKVLEVIPGSHAERMGLNGGDIILSINGKDIQTVDGVHEALKQYPNYTWIDVMSWEGCLNTYEYKCYPDGYNSLGIIAVPRERDITYNTDYFEHMSILKNIVDKFRDAGSGV